VRRDREGPRIESSSGDDVRARGQSRGGGRQEQSRMRRERGGGDARREAREGGAGRAKEKR